MESNLIPSNALYLKIVMGDVVDYFKPVEGKTYSEMLQSNLLHQWSSDGKNWVIPTYYPGADHFGGSANGYPTDGRSYLSFWGHTRGNVYGGCCTYSYNNAVVWNKAFIIFYGIGKFHILRFFQVYFYEKKLNYFGVVINSKIGSLKMIVFLA